MSDTTLYDTTAPSEGSVALAHQRIIRQKVDGVFVNITGDVNNLALNPTPITVAREAYGFKGKPAMDIIGYSFAPTFTIETIRDPATKQVVVSQGWLVDLIAAAYQAGEDNRLEFQIITDALDERFPAFEGKFSVAVADLATGAADKGGYNVTLTSFGDVAILDENPIAGNGTPIVETATPSGATVGDQLVLRGYNFEGVTGITIDGQAVTKFKGPDQGLEDNTIVLVIPATVAGSAPIVVTNGAGAGASKPYTAA